MKIEALNQIGNVKVEKGAVKKYRNAPGDFMKAAVAAIYYARKNNEDMVLIPGNSYGAKIFHIARTSDDLKKYTVMASEASVALVKTTGEVFQAVVN